MVVESTCECGWRFVFNTLFGLSMHFWMALATRFLLGSLNGLLGPMRAYAVEVCRPEHQAIGLSLVSTSWAMGLVIGPAIGGYLAQFQIFPLWAESDRSYGGLSLSSEDVGQVLAITGASILLYQTFIYPHKVKVLGPINASRVTSIFSMLLLLTLPFMTHLSRPWLLIVLNISSVLKANFAVTVVTSSVILQNNSVPQGQRGIANGLANTLMSFSKALAPAGAGDEMVFLFLGTAAIIEFIWTFKPFLAVPDQFRSTWPPIHTIEKVVRSHGIFIVRTGVQCEKGIAYSQRTLSNIKLKANENPCIFME
ncbi:protein ZINC INDUCED FACILITATOR-LIKE 1-like isoform X4 [Panicum miliaceum]|uniref:Protein ZINC INDUCED FACILITATOR-LIKE 1-like isoform X4 n=1 Tax=Panicum miliaceum TaxID=4540 RepID=A0A3L6PMC0_PANMI|nr:protein ZINC INDUCED FACILITATOR-LIKE 1-like isoform X4 [Panicum miliaceum]